MIWITPSEKHTAADALEKRLWDARAVAYQNVAGLCKAATLKEVEAQGWSFNPGRSVGMAPGEAV
jgi:type I restriction enzyme M protein